MSSANQTWIENDFKPITKISSKDPEILYNIKYNVLQKFPARSSILNFILKNVVLLFNCCFLDTIINESFRQIIQPCKYIFNTMFYIL